MGNYIRTFINEHTIISKQVFQFYEMSSKLQWSAGNKINQLISDGNNLGLVINQQKWKTCFSLVESSKCVEITFISFQSSILTQLSNIKFSLLQSLNLCQNNMKNIESLQFLHCPCLKKLDLSNNNITTIKALSKCLHLNQITYMSLNENPLSNIQTMCIAKMKNLKELILQIAFCDKFQNCLIESVSMLVKLQTGSFDQIYLQNQSRIQQLPVYNQIKNKNVHIMMKRSNFMKF